MTRFHNVAFAIVMGAFALTGCSSLSRSETSTIAGGAVGAVVGAAVGGTAATAAGAVLGGVVGHELEKKR